MIIPDRDGINLLALGEFLEARRRGDGLGTPYGDIDLGAGIVFDAAHGVFTCPDDEAAPVGRDRLTRGIYTLRPPEQLHHSAIVALLAEDLSTDSWYFNHGPPRRLASMIDQLQWFYPLRSRWVKAAIARRKAYGNT